MPVSSAANDAAPAQPAATESAPPPPLLKPQLKPAVEIGGVAGPDPTRFGDWEKSGRCIDF
jgi:hypothetical protein